MQFPACLYTIDKILKFKIEWKALQFCSTWLLLGLSINIYWWAFLVYYCSEPAVTHACTHYSPELTAHILFDTTVQIIMRFTEGRQHHQGSLQRCWCRSSNTWGGRWGTWWGRWLCCTCRYHWLSCRISLLVVGPEQDEEEGGWVVEGGGRRYSLPSCDLQSCNLLARCPDHRSLCRSACSTCGTSHKPGKRE